jgi:tetratricopeptide (TPR) repeat protein
LLAERGENLDEAARWIESALELDPTFEANFAESLAFVELRRGHAEAALRASDRGLAAAPRPALQAALLSRRGEALARLGRPQEALQSLRQALSLAAEGPTAQRVRRLLQEIESAAETGEAGS